MTFLAAICSCDCCPCQLPTWKFWLVVLPPQVGRDVCKGEPDVELSSMSHTLDPFKVPVLLNCKSLSDNINCPLEFSKLSSDSISRVIASWRYRPSTILHHDFLLSNFSLGPTTRVLVLVGEQLWRAYVLYRGRRRWRCRCHMQFLPLLDQDWKLHTQ